MKIYAIILVGIYVLVDLQFEYCMVLLLGVLLV